MMSAIVFPSVKIALCSFIVFMARSLVDIVDHDYKINEECK